MQKPQPVNPELPSWPVSGFLHILKNFRGKSQPFVEQHYVSLELLGNSPSFIFVVILCSFLDMKLVHKFLKLFSSSVTFGKSLGSSEHQLPVFNQKIQFTKIKE